MKTIARVFLTNLSLFVLIGCGEEKITSGLKDTSKTSSFMLPISSAKHGFVDLALILDNSGSMGEELGSLKTYLIEALHLFKGNARFYIPQGISPQVGTYTAMGVIEQYEWWDSNGLRQISPTKPIGIPLFDQRYMPFLRDSLPLNQNRIELDAKMTDTERADKIADVAAVIDSRIAALNGGGTEAGLGVLGPLTEKLASEAHGTSLGVIIATDNDDLTATSIDLPNTDLAYKEVTNYPNNFKNGRFNYDILVDVILKYYYRVQHTQKRVLEYRYVAGGPVFQTISAYVVDEPSTVCPLVKEIPPGTTQYTRLSGKVTVDSPHITFLCTETPQYISHSGFSTAGLCTGPVGAYPDIYAYAQAKYGAPANPGTCTSNTYDTAGTNLRTKTFTELLSDGTETNYYRALAYKIKKTYGMSAMFGFMIRDSQLEAGANCGAAEGEGQMYKAFSELMKSRGYASVVGSVCIQNSYREAVLKFSKKLQEQYSRTIILDMLEPKQKLVGVDYIQPDGTVILNILYTFEGGILTLLWDGEIFDDGQLLIHTSEETLG